MHQVTSELSLFLFVMLQMAFTSFIAFVTILLLQPLSATSGRGGDGDNLFITPASAKDCRGKECGKGTCKPTNDSLLHFECECDRGWKQVSNDDDEGFEFLPCIIPDCTINPTCSKAPAPPAPQMAPKENFTLLSLLNACHYIDCGGGLCHNKATRFSYSCECNAGYYNLFNKTAFPCFKECALGMGCSELGISKRNTSSPPAPSGLNEGSSILRGSSLWLVLLIMVMLFL